MFAPCTLNCKNGGYCSSHAHDGATAPTTKVSGAHEIKNSSDQFCVCPHGWTGLSCLEPIETIDPCHNSGDSYVCRSGGLCHSDKSFSNLNDEEQEWKCDCKLADAVNAFAGAMCREPAIEYCNSDTFSFCTNGGTCVSNLINFSHSEITGDCICPPDFTGPHCEFLSILFGMGNYPRANGKDTLMRNNNTFDVTLFLFLSIVALVSAIFLFTWRKMKSSRFSHGRNYDYNRSHFNPVVFNDNTDTSGANGREEFILYDVPLT